MTLQDPAILKEIAAAMEPETSKGNVVALPDDAPFDPVQRQWLNGLLTGLNAIASSLSADSGEEAPGTPLNVLYGSQSGNCEALSKDLRKYAATQGFEANVAVLDDVALADLANMNHVMIVAATFGEGEPTDNAANFYAALMAADAPALPATLNYSVCGLGDSSYAEFNKCAIDIDARLAELGATRVQDLQSCDVAFEDDYADWKTATFETEAFKSAAGAASAPAAAEEPGPAFDKNRPFMASLLTCDGLNGEGSAKCVNHVEISLAGGGVDLDYAVGDALGVWPVNDPAEVTAILEATGLQPREPVALKSGDARLQAALLTKLDLTTVTPNTLEAWGLEPQDDAQIIDLLREQKPELSAQQLVEGMRPLQPRLYSISSSPKKHPGEVHLTVGEVHYNLHDSPRKGVASTFLGQRLMDGGSLGVYVQRSAHFHIPADDNVPLIMIGPGTGIAPFRAFLEEREMRQAPGRNWLFFGDQHEASDYLYRDELEGWMDSGVLDKASLAWSRDGADKVYVQTLIERDGAEFFQWLEDGAAIYICGDASRMASDVDATIRRVIAEHGGHDEAGVEAYMQALTAGHRYQRDVY